MNSDKEVWKQFAENYEVSSYGRVRSLGRSKLRKDPVRILTNNTDRYGYEYVGIYNNGVRQSKWIARLVAENFIDNPDGKPQVNHIDGVKTNNHVENLEWVTHKENIQHAVDTGLRACQKGESNHYAKLNWTKVRFIRKNKDKYTQYELADIFNVSRSAIAGVVNNYNWKEN